MHEAQLHPENCFITLTYDGEHLPADLSLHKEDAQWKLHDITDIDIGIPLPH